MERTVNVPVHVCTACLGLQIKGSTHVVVPRGLKVGSCESYERQEAGGVTRQTCMR
jgi:hypothetical protein